MEKWLYFFWEDKKRIKRVMSLIKWKDQILEEMFEELRSRIKKNVPSFLYLINVTALKNSAIYAIIRIKDENFGEQKKLFETVKNISECVYKHYSRDS